MTVLTQPARKLWTEPSELVKHIVARHHASLRQKLPHLDRLLDRIVLDATKPSALLEQVRRDFTTLADLLDTHVTQQEGWLFPRILHLCDSVSASGWACEWEDHLKEALDSQGADSREALERARKVCQALKDPAWSLTGPAGRDFAAAMPALLADLQEHLDLESNILFPDIRDLLRLYGKAAANV